MHIQTAVWTRYSQVHSLAKKAVRLAEREGVEVYPKELKYALDRTRVAGEKDLGKLEIPVNRIIGTAVFDEKDLYSPDFLPLASADSPFAREWCQLYLDYLRDRGWDHPIRCVEYLGYFYVLDGKKRTSILKTHGAATTMALVTRILPVYSDEKETALYYEFLKDYEKTGLYQVTFSQSGGFAKLQAALGYEEGYQWNDMDRFSFLFNLIPVEYALHMAFGENLKITAADALLVLLEEYAFSQIRNMQPWDLCKALQDSWVKLYRIVDPDFVVAPTGAA